MSYVWDPIIEIQFKHTGAQSSGAEWVSSVYELPPGEVIEVFRMEIIPPVDTTTGTIKKLKYVTLMIDGKEYPTIRANSVMLPAESPNNAGVAVNFGTPYLWRPITGRIPAPIEGICPKAKAGQTLGVKVVAEDALTDTDVYTIILKCARVRGEGKLVEAVGPVIVPGFSLDTDTYAKSAIPIRIDTWDELPGGLAQSKPQVFPLVTYARNKVATTPNIWYDFDYKTGKVDSDWMNLSWNLVNKEEAYIINAIGVIPNANSKSLRLYIDGRITNPEFTTRPLPEKNIFYPAMFYDVNVNNALKRAGPVFLPKPFMFHGVKGGVQIVDNGTAIPANGVEVHVYGIKFVLR